MELHYRTKITPQTDLESWHRQKAEEMLSKILNTWLCNVQPFPRV